MKSFANTLSVREIQDVALFVQSEFVEKRATNTFYHTPENGWPDHRERYEAAFQFVKGETAMDKALSSLTPKQRRGLALFTKTCITCHGGGKVKEAGEVWSKYPLSDQGCGVMCHRDGTVDFPWRQSYTHRGTGSRPATPYDVHNRAPVIHGLSAVEAKGEALYQANCAFCHAMDGTGENWIGSFLEPNARNLKDPKLTAYLDKEALLKAIREGLPGTSMPAWGTVMTFDQIDAVAAYVDRAFLHAPFNDEAAQASDRNYNYGDRGFN